MSDIQVSGNNILIRGRGRDRCVAFHLCRFNWSVVTGRKEFLSCLVFIVTFFVKGMDIFDKVVAGCGFLDTLENILGIL